MELFKKTNFDFLGHKWPFIIASIVLSVAGIASLVAKGGPRYGIEFKGGTLMTVKFRQMPALNKLRAELSRNLSAPPTVQEFENGTNEVAIGTEGADDTLRVRESLARIYGQPGGKLDLNNASRSALAARLGDPLQRAGASLSQQDVDRLADAIVAERDQKHGGLLSSPDDLGSVPGVTPAVLNVLKQEAYAAPYNAARDTQAVGPKAGADLRQQAINATLLALAGMLVYIWFRFEWIYGVAAVIAVFHDTLITIGVFSLLNKEITLTVIAALLTLVGYSMNDTIVIFDRIRENLHLNRKERLADVINRSINQTLSRTVMTSGLTFLAVLTVFVWRTGAAWFLFSAGYRYYRGDVFVGVRG